MKKKELVSNNFKKIAPIVILILIFSSMNFSGWGRLQLLAVIHGLIYVVLGIKLRQTLKSKYIWIAAIVLVAILDEAYQGILPHRFFDLSDIMWNIVGGLVGGFILAY